MFDEPIDILILSNGPGEVSTWVRPVVKSLRQKLTNDRSLLRISVVLSPCTHAMGAEADVARSYPEVDRVQEPDGFFAFLLRGKTKENWDWRSRGIVLFLGGDQFYTLAIGKRLGYRTAIYAEWEARWYRWIDRFGVMNREVLQSVPEKYRDKCTVVGDLMVDLPVARTRPETPTIALLPGSKPWKLAQGVPLTLSIASEIHRRDPRAKFFIPVAPTVRLSTLARFADRDRNEMIARTGWTDAKLIEGENPYLETPTGLKVDLVADFPSHDRLSRCHLALTTVGANTAELGALGIPMIVLLPTQQLDAMRTWDGLPGLLANLPGVGASLAKLINTVMIRKNRLYAWPNLWAGEAIVPELLGKLQPVDVADLAISWLENPDTLEEIRQRLRAVRGESGAVDKLAAIVAGLAIEG
jgi:lipid-A-disaccharide synthase